MTFSVTKIVEEEIGKVRLQYDDDGRGSVSTNAVNSTLDALEARIKSRINEIAHLLGSSPLRLAAANPTEMPRKPHGKETAHEH